MQQHCPLNPGELRLLQHIANGDTRDTAARAVGFSPKSMHTVMHRIFTKTHTLNAPNLVATALRQGWIA